MAYGGEFERRRPWRRRRRGRMSPWGRRPGRPAHGYPVRGFHTYDLDYGRQAGGPEDYSGRAGWPTGVPEEATRPLPRGAWAYGAWYGYGPLWRRRWRPRLEERYEPGEEPPSFERWARRRRSRPGWP